MNDERIVWTDLETFGLVPNHDPIIEIGFLITDLHLNRIGSKHVLVWEDDLYNYCYDQLVENAASPNEAVAQPASYVYQMHRHSNLWIEAKQNGIGVVQAETELHEWFDEMDINGQDPLAGSSVAFDRGMLLAQMERLALRLHYRNIDVSSVKELCRRYNPEVYAKLETSVFNRKAHRSMSDLDDTISEFRFYRDNFLWVTK